MKKLALGALFAGLAACGGGGGGDNPSIIVPDGGGPVGCSPTTQMGCDANEKCTWIDDSDTIGHIGCAPDGNIALGATCTNGTPGPMGYDMCAKGNYCLGGECKQICDSAGGAPACDSQHSCSQYDGLFTSSGTTVAGVCDPGCNPLTQELLIGNKAACDSPDPTMPTKGCYGQDEFSCTGAYGGLTATDYQPPKTDPAGTVFINSCSPGYMPFFYKETGSMEAVCSGLCAAGEADNTQQANAVGVAAALGKLVTDPAPVAGHATCDKNAKGSEDSSRCRFIWPYNQNDDGSFNASFQNGPYFDTLGICMATAHYKYDPDGDGGPLPLTEIPTCDMLPPPSAATTGDSDDAADWGCYKYSNTPMTLTSSGHRRAPRGAQDIQVGTNTNMKMAVERHPLL